MMNLNPFRISFHGLVVFVTEFVFFKVYLGILWMCVHKGNKVRSFKEHGYAIIISLKTMTFFNNTSAEIKTKSADLLWKMVIVLSEIR